MSFIINHFYLYSLASSWFSSACFLRYKNTLGNPELSCFFLIGTVFNAASIMSII